MTSIIQLPADARPRSMHLVRALDRLAVLTAGWRGLWLAVAIATVPFALSWACHRPGYHLISGALLPLAILPQAWAGRIGMAMLSLATAFACHCLLTMTATWLDPAGVVAAAPACADYLHRQELWIATGQDPEYQVSNWLPAHLRLIAIAVIASVLTLGSLVHIQGFFEVDLMNYYSACLAAHGQHPLLTLMWAWHPWSLLRGMGFLLLTLEGSVLTIAWLSRRRLSSPSGSAWRAGLGIAFLVGDGLLKYSILEMSRVHLANELAQIPGGP